MTASPARLLGARCGGAWTARPLGASGFCSTWRAEGPDRALFVKTLPLRHADVLAAEADGLGALAQTRTIAVPRVEGCWTDDEQGVAVLAMQWLDFGPMRGEASGRRFGEALAALHRAAPVEGGGRFGWRRDNMLGGTPQRNRWSEADGLPGWVELFGAPPAGFWPAYREIAPVAPGYAWRRGLYQLYHLLNHELLFGGYARRAMEVIAALP